jgi:hypothetical protein
MSAPEPGLAVPRIPPPPPIQRRRGGDGRWIIWLFLLVLGAIVGAAFYQWLPGISLYFDYWIALVLH